MRRKTNLCILAAAFIGLWACSGPTALKPTQAVQKGVATSPASSQMAPIAITQPNASVTITVSEARYHGGFSASIYTGEHCVNVAPVNGTMDLFTVSRVIGCNSVLIKVVDDVGNSASVFLRTK